MRALLWDPPQPYSDAIDAGVRWPGQSVRQQYHVELALVGIAVRLSLGVLVLGLLLRASTWLFARRQPDGLVSLAWCLSLSLVIAWICILAIGAFTFGYGLSDGVVITILALGLVGGCGFATWALRHHPSTSASTPATAGGTAPVVREAGAQPRKAPAALSWFTVGIISAVCLTVAAGWIASFFRGPVVGVWELGTPRYAKDQTPTNLLTGVGILSAGWIIGVMTYRLRIPRALSVGLIVGTTFLGITFAFWH